MQVLINILTVFTVILLTSAIILFILGITGKLGSEDKEEKRLRLLLPKKKSKILNIADIGIFFYLMFEKAPLISRFMNNIESRVVMLDIGNEYETKRKVGLYAFLSLLSLVGVSLLSIFVTSNIYGQLAVFVAAMYVAFIVYDRMVNGLYKKMLYAQRDMLREVKDAYHQTKMPAASLQSSAETCSPLVRNQTQRIADVLTSLDPEEELLKYYEIAPNDHMRKLADISYNVQRFVSDEDPNEKPILIESIDNIDTDIRMEIDKRERLDMATSGTMFMAVAPVFAFEPLKNWTANSLPGMSEFMDSKMGFYTLIILLATTLISFFGLVFVKNLGMTKESLSEGKFLSMVLRNRTIRKLVRRITPIEVGFTNKEIMTKSERILYESNSRLTLIQFYLSKSLWCIGIFVLALFVQVLSHDVSRTVILDEKAYDAPTNTNREYEERGRRIFEHLAVKELANIKLSNSVDRRQYMYDYLYEKALSERFIWRQENPENYLQGVVNKVVSYENEKFMWYEILIALALSAVGFNIPNFILQLKSSIRRQEMQEEVDGFYSQLIVLSRIENVMVYDLIDYMHRYSSIFRPYLLKCLVNFEAGPAKALEELKMDVKFPTFQIIVGRLQRSLEHLDIKDAFNDIKADREMSLDEKRRGLEDFIGKRARMANMLGWAPIVVLAGGYLLLPFIVVMFEQFTSIMEMMDRMGG